MDSLRQEPTFAAAADTPAPRRRRRSGMPWLLAIAVLAALAAGVWVFFLQERAAPPQATVAPQPAARDAAQAAATAPVAASSEPRFPLAAASSAPIAADGVQAALVEALGADAVQRFLQATDFPQRVVATLDGLGREHAPVRMWPVVPTPGRFMVDEEVGAARIAAANAARYEAFVGFATALDAQRVVDLYRRLYPLLQQAYRDLGFGDRYLNDRVIEVIDLLLATPETKQAPEVVLTDVKGPFPSTQPWTRYEFADPQWQSLTAGQKMLLRMGADNRLRLKAKLREIRIGLVAAR